MTNEDGQLVLTELEPGDYRFVETKAPVGYELDNQPIEFTIDDKQTERILLTKDNVIIKGSAVLKKSTQPLVNHLKAYPLSSSKTERQ